MCLPFYIYVNLFFSEMFQCTFVENIITSKKFSDLLMTF